MRTFPCKTVGCGGSYSVEAPESFGDWTEDDIDHHRDAMYEHMAAHPDSLKVPPSTAPPRKRDWVGCRCKGRTCHCPPRRRQPTQRY